MILLNQITATKSPLNEAPLMKEMLKGLALAFKKSLSFCFTSLVFGFVLIQSAVAQGPPPPPVDPTPTVPAGGPWVYGLLVAAIAVYAVWRKK